MPVKLTCSYCQKPFERKGIDKRNKNNYCSKKCMYLSQQEQKSDELSPFRYILKEARKRSKRYNRELSIDEKYLKSKWDEQQGVCVLSGEVLDLGENCNARNSGKKTASLDRIDSLMGYVPDNVQHIHKDIQDMKMDKPEDVFIYWCRKVAEYTKDRVIAIPFAVPTHAEYTETVADKDFIPY